jgi:hypothetical protein
VTVTATTRQRSKNITLQTVYMTITVEF